MYVCVHLCIHVYASACQVMLSLSFGDYQAPFIPSEHLFVSCFTQDALLLLFDWECILCYSRHQLIVICLLIACLLMLVILNVSFHKLLSHWFSLIFFSLLFILNCLSDIVDPYNEGQNAGKYFLYKLPMEFRHFWNRKWNVGKRLFISTVPLSTYQLVH